MRNVKPGIDDQGMTAVQGLAAGTVVATSSFEKLQDGAGDEDRPKPRYPSNATESNTLQSVTPVYSSARRHIAVDGGDPAG